MDLNLIQKICGIQPDNFTAVLPKDSNYIFKNDVNFAPLNLYDFFGRAATVNSYEECFYYVSLGFEPDKYTIFDLGFSFFQITVPIIILFFLYKYGFAQAIINKIRSIGINSNFLRVLLSSFFIIQTYFVFDYVRTKASRIPRFIDEYISLASNLNFYKNLDFNAGDFIGGSYSIYLTSGPISALGGVIGWNLSSKLMIARISNYFWLVILQLIFAIYISKIHKTKYSFLVYMSFFIILLTPWWIGSLYMIGEFASVIIFTNAIFLFNKNRKFAFLLFSISIFFGKLLILLPCAVFIIVNLFNEKDFKNLLNDLFYFFLPLAIWLVLIDVNSDEGVFKYLENIYYLIFSHQSSGVEVIGFDIFTKFIDSIFSSEVNNWNNFDVIRLAVVPPIFFLLAYKKKSNFTKIFGNIINPFLFSTISIYLWFWLISPTKWMRYSQHFSILIIISIIYFINFNVINSKLDLFMGISLIAVFIDNEKNLIWILIFLTFIVLFLNFNINKVNVLKSILVVILLVDISIPYFEKDSFANLNDEIPSCSNSFISDECRNNYLNN